VLARHLLGFPGPIERLNPLAPDDCTPTPRVVAAGERISDLLRADLPPATT